MFLYCLTLHSVCIVLLCIVRYLSLYLQYHFNNTFNMDIKGTIKRHGYTLEKLGNEIGVTKATISNMITKGNPTLSTLRKIANVLGCSITDFFEDETNVQSTTFVCPRCGASLNISVKEKKHE